MNVKRTCKGICKGYRVKKPASGGRYEAGQGRCQVCDVWMSYHGAHLKDGSPAKAGSTGWFCNCCNFRIRQKPRSKTYKERLRSEDAKPEVPKYHDMMLPILQICGDGMQRSMSELADLVADEFEMTERERSWILRRTETLLSNRVSWAVLYLRKAGLVMSDKGSISITEHGTRILQQRPDKIDRKFLMGIPEFAEFYSRSNKRADDKDESRADEQKRKRPTNGGRMDRINHLIAEAMRLIKSSPAGAYMEDLKTLLNISQEEMSSLATRLKRVDGMSITQIHRDGEPFGFLFRYDETGNMNQEQEQESSGRPTGAEHMPKPAQKSVEDLARQMLDEHYKNKAIKKALQRDLTVEFLKIRSVRGVITNHPDIAKDEVKRHIRSPLRLPAKLRELNEGGLHPNPDLSLQIALFAVNHHDWDGQKEQEGDVLRTAESVSAWIASNASSEGRVRGMSDRPASDKERFSEDGAAKSGGSEGSIPTAIAVWIATATLHVERGVDAIFSNSDIIEKMMRQKLCNVSHNTISAHVAAHCVANAPANTQAAHRKTYRVGPGRYRLYRRNEPCHPTRKNCKIAPLPFQMPDEYRDLRKWYDEVYCK